MTLREELTFAEQTMFRGLDWGYLFDTDIHAPQLYKMAVEKAFTFAIKNKFSAALREANFRLIFGKYRGNDEHDNTIIDAMNNYVP